MVNTISYNKRQKNEQFKFTGDGQTISPNQSATLMSGYNSSDGKAYYLPITSNGLKVDTEFNDISVLRATGSSAISFTTTGSISTKFQLEKVTCFFSSAPSTSENFTINLDSGGGSAYDTNLFSFDPSVVSATDIAYIPPVKMNFVAGDAITVSFTNTNSRTYGLSVYYSSI